MAGFGRSAGEHPRSRTEAASWLRKFEDFCGAPLDSIDRWQFTGMELASRPVTGYRTDSKSNRHKIVTVTPVSCLFLPWLGKPAATRLVNIPFATKAQIACTESVGRSPVEVYPRGSLPIQ
jgi:hypothetical protein